MGYRFKYLTLVDKGKIKPISIYRKFKEINPKLTFFKMLYRFLIKLLFDVQYIMIDIFHL